MREVAHLGRAGRVVDGVGGPAGVAAEVGVRGDVGARGDFAFEPGGEGRAAGDLAGGAEAGDEGGGVVAGGVGEVVEVEGGLGGGGGRGEVEAALGLGAGDVGRHAEGVERGVVAEAGGVEAEGDLVAVHHDVGDARGVVVVVAVAVAVAGAACRGAGEEDAGVRVHGRLVRGHGPVEFPHDDAFRVVEEVVADAGDRGDDGDAEGGQMGGGPDAGEEEEARGVDCAGAEDGFLAGGQGEGGAGLEGYVDTCHGFVADVDAADPGVGEDGEVGSVLVAAEDGVDVRHARTAPAAVVGVVSYGEESDAGFEVPVCGDLAVEVVDHGDGQGGGARFHPVFAELVAVTGMDWLDGVADFVDEAVEGFEGPAGAALGLPYGGVVGEGTERDEGVVGRAAAEDFGARVADVRVSCMSMNLIS